MNVPLIHSSTHSNLASIKNTTETALRRSLKAKVTQLCPTLCNPMDYICVSVCVCVYCPWNSPGQNTGVGSLSLLQGIFPTQGLNLDLPQCRQILYQRSYERSPRRPLSSVQFSSVTQSCPTLCDPMNRSTPGLPVHHQLPGFTQTHAHRVGDAIQPSHPLSSPSPPAPNPSQHQGLFQ